MINNPSTEFKLACDLATRVLMERADELFFDNGNLRGALTDYGDSLRKEREQSEMDKAEIKGLKDHAVKQESDVTRMRETMHDLKMQLEDAKAHHESERNRADAFEKVNNESATCIETQRKELQRLYDIETLHGHQAETITVMQKEVSELRNALDLTAKGLALHKDTYKAWQEAQAQLQQLQAANQKMEITLVGFMKWLDDGAEKDIHYLVVNWPAGQEGGEILKLIRSNLKFD